MGCGVWDVGCGMWDVGQAEVNKSEFAGEGDETRKALMGVAVGRYVRLEFQDVPAELVRHFQVCSEGVYLGWCGDEP